MPADSTTAVDAMASLAASLASVVARSTAASSMNRVQSAADMRYPRPQSFPSESWPTPPLARVADPDERVKLQAELDASAAGSPESFARLVLSTTIAEYIGERCPQTGLPHGHGRAVFKAGQTYEGAFDQGLMHGQGVYTWIDESGSITSYTGRMTYQSVTGVGLLVFPDGSTYQGEVLDGFRHGEGVFIDPSVPCLYEGSWVHGLRHGKGKLTYDEGGASYYEGEWCEGARHGYGLLRYSSGNLYEGAWVWDRKVGHGKMTWFTRNQRYIGEWLNDLPHGEGEYTWLDLPVAGVKQPIDSVRTVAGHIIGGNSNNKQQSLVTHFQHPNRYTGTFVQGSRTGYGIMHFSNGAVYEGEWQDDRKHGHGRFTFANGSVYDGEFVEDTMADEKRWHHPYSGVVEALDGLTSPQSGRASVTSSHQPQGRTAKALEAATHAAQKDVGMFDLPLDALLTAHADALGFHTKHPARAGFLQQQRDGLTNLLLRYNTELLDVYRFYASLDIDVSRPRYQPPQLPFVPMSPTGAPGAHSSPSAAAARLNLAQMWILLQDLHLIGHPDVPSELTLATLDRIILAGTDAANHALIDRTTGNNADDEPTSVHDGRHVLLLREFAQALIRIADAVYDAPSDSVSSVTVSEESKEQEPDAAVNAEAEHESIEEEEEKDPAVLYARAQDQFNLLLTGVDPNAPPPAFSPTIVATNEMSLPPLSLLSPPSVGGPNGTSSPRQSPGSTGVGPSSLPSKSHSRRPSGSSTGTPSQQRSQRLGSPFGSTRSHAHAVAMEGKSMPFSSTAASPAAATSGGVSLGAFQSTSSFLQTQHLRTSPNTLAVRFKRFLLEFLLPHARMRSKHGFTSSNNSSYRGGRHDTASDTKLVVPQQPIYRAPTIVQLVKRHERALYFQLFLPCSTVHPLASRMITAAVSSDVVESNSNVNSRRRARVLEDRTASLESLLACLQASGVCFSSPNGPHPNGFTFYHALQILFGPHYARANLHLALGRELIWEEFVEVLVRIALYRGHILHQLAESIQREREAAATAAARKQEEEAAAAAAAAAAEAKAQEENAASGNLLAVTPEPDSAAIRSKSPTAGAKGAAGMKASPSLKSLNGGKAAAGTAATSSSSTKKAAPTTASAKKEAAKKEVTTKKGSGAGAAPLASNASLQAPAASAAARSSSPDPNVTTAAANPSSAGSTNPNPSPSASPSQSARHAHHVSLSSPSGSGLESGSLKKRSSPALDPAALGDDLASLTLTPEFGSQASLVLSQSQQAPVEADYERWAGDVEQLFCALLHKPLPETVRTSFPRDLL